MANLQATSRADGTGEAYQGQGGAAEEAWYSRAMRWSLRLREMDPLVEETIVAACTMAAFGGLATLVYWLATGHSPWPGFALGEVAGFGFGTAMLALTAPKRRG